MKRFFTLAFLLSATLLGAQNRFTCKFELYNVKTGGEKALICGTAYIQDLCYRLESEDGFVRGNGTDRWIYYSGTEELVIQKDDPSIFSKITLTKAEQGSAVVTYADFKAKLSKITEMEAKPESFFVVGESELGKNVIVTDLRD